MNETTAQPKHFIRQIIEEDISNKKHAAIVTRFPPEPNGYLHIGHAKSICLNFGLARDFPGSKCFLRFDDTNPEKENQEYIDNIIKDVHWLGFDWGTHQTHASNYFSHLYEFAVQLIKQGDAYVDSLNADEIREYRGTLTEPGKNSPYRDRSTEENLNLFEEMKAGKYQEGEHILRAKIDMSSPNINLRDPIIYRIRHAEHHQTGSEWCIYPMYDFTHCLSDAMEEITHSLCSLEFEDHRPLYNWFLEKLNTPARPQQIEFSRLNLEYTVMSKRKLHQLVEENYVNGWDDPRMPTIAGLRRRGYTPASLQLFCERIGVTKSDNTIEMSLLEGCIRESLELEAPRAMCVLNPLKVTITSIEPDHAEEITTKAHPNNESLGERTLHFTKEIYIDRSDFEEVPPPKFKRLISGGEVRLRNAYVIKCDDVIKDDAGNIVELRCSHDPDTLGKKPEGRKVKGVIHWVSANRSLPAEIRLYDRLFNVPNPNKTDDGKTFLDNINPESYKVITDCRVETSVEKAPIGERFQFEREGYFCIDPATKPGHLVFNRTVTLRDSWAKVTKK